MMYKYYKIYWLKKNSVNFSMKRTILIFNFFYSGIFFSEMITGPGFTVFKVYFNFLFSNGINYIATEKLSVMFVLV